MKVKALFVKHCSYCGFKEVEKVYKVNNYYKCNRCSSVFPDDRVFAWIGIIIIAVGLYSIF